MTADCRKLARQLLRFKETNHPFTSLIDSVDIASAQKLAPVSGLRQDQLEEDYPLHWAESKRSFTTALKRLRAVITETSNAAYPIEASEAAKNTEDVGDGTTPEMEQTIPTRFHQRPSDHLNDPDPESYIEPSSPNPSVTSHLSTESRLTASRPHDIARTAETHPERLLRDLIDKHGLRSLSPNPGLYPVIPAEHKAEFRRFLQEFGCDVETIPPATSAEISGSENLHNRETGQGRGNLSATGRSKIVSDVVDVRATATTASSSAREMSLPLRLGNPTGAVTYPKLPTSMPSQPANPPTTATNAYITELLKGINSQQTTESKNTPRVQSEAGNTARLQTTQNDQTNTPEYLDPQSRGLTRSQARSRVTGAEVRNTTRMTRSDLKEEICKLTTRKHLAISSANAVHYRIEMLLLEWQFDHEDSSPRLTSGTGAQGDMGTARTMPARLKAEVHELMREKRKQQVDVETLGLQIDVLKAQFWNRM